MRLSSRPTALSMSNTIDGADGAVLEHETDYDD